MTPKPHPFETAAMVFLIVMFLASMVCADEESAPSPAVSDAINGARIARQQAALPEPWPPR